MPLRFRSCLLVFAFSMASLSGQTIFISSLENQLFEVDLANCTQTFVTNINGSTTDISFRPNGQLYAIGGDGEIYELDINTGNLTQLGTIGPTFQFFTALTSDADGLLYAAGLSDELWTYDVETNQSNFVGDIGFAASGDLTFYEANLYMASLNDDIVLVDIDNPSNSSVVINGNVPGEIFGIVSFAEDCSNISSYALTDDSNGIYLIDYEDMSISLFCDLNISASGGASTFEFLGANVPIDIIEVNTDGFDCAGGGGTISIEAEGGNGALSYSIDGNTYQASPDFVNVPLQDYIIYVQDEEGCIEETQILIEPEDGPQIGLVQINVPNCEENNGQIWVRNVTGNGPFQYSINDGISFSPDSIFTDIAPGFYNVVVRDGAGCRVENMVEVLVTGAPFIEDFVVGYEDCERTSALVTVLASGDAAPLQYAVDGGDFDSNREFIITETGTYTFSIIDFTGCIRSQELFVEVNNSLVLQDIMIENTSCNENNGQLEAIVSGGIGQLSYSLNGGSQSTGLFTDLAAGTYELVVTDEEMCSLREDIIIEASSTPTIDQVTSTNATCTEPNGSILVETSGGAAPIQLTLNGQANSANQTINNLAGGDYFIEVIDNLGCRDTASVRLLRDNCPIYVPNVFSPNNDGVNDYFEVYASFNAGARIERLAIYDRWGGQVFEVTDRELGDRSARWDGSYRGRDAMMGVYVYQLDIRYENGDLVQQTGDVTLLR